MLVLTRKRTEQIVIGSGIRITVLKLERNQVRIGIEAPAEMPILRAELLEQEHDDRPAGQTFPVSTSGERAW